MCHSSLLSHAPEGTISQFREASAVGRRPGLVLQLGWSYLCEPKPSCCGLNGTLLLSAGGPTTRFHVSFKRFQTVWVLKLLILLIFNI